MATLGHRRAVWTPGFQSVWYLLAIHKEQSCSIRQSKGKILSPLSNSDLLGLKGIQAATFKHRRRRCFYLISVYLLCPEIVLKLPFPQRSSLSALVHQSGTWNTLTMPFLLQRPGPSPATTEFYSCTLDAVFNYFSFLLASNILSWRAGHRTQETPFPPNNQKRGKQMTRVGTLGGGATEVTHALVKKPK